MKFISSLLLLCCMAAFAQTTPTDQSDSVYIADYYNLRALYIKYVDARNATKAHKLLEEFILKAKCTKNLQELNGFNGIIIWVRENISKTSFKNVAEADKLWQELKTAELVKPLEEIAYYEEEKKMSEKHGRQIVRDVMMNRGAGGRDPKEEPDYKAAYEKLKNLTVEHRSSESFRNVRSLENAYTKKANFNRKTDKFMYPETIYDWVVKNLTRTGFSSLTEAKLEWKKVEDAQNAERKANAAYYDFSSECLSKYGPYMGSDVMFDIMGS